MKINQNQHILILGANGLLGSSLVPFLELNGYMPIKHSRDPSSQYNADLTHSDDVFVLIDLIKPSIIINLAGLTDVDYCESNPDEAYGVNCKIVENIVGWLKKIQFPCHLIQVSTDQVYDGSGPHVEDQVTPKNYYSLSKYAGELAAAAVPSTILRTNFFGYSHCTKRQSLTDWLYRALKNGDEIQVFDDILFSPLSMSTLSEIIEFVIKYKPIGLFNLGSHEGMSKADFAFFFADILGLQTNNMVRTTTDKVTFLRAYRPKDMRMNCFKFEKTLGVKLKLPKLKDEIKRVTKEYHEES